MDLPERLHRHIVRRARRFPEVERVVLYGSRARGDNDPRSDVDLCVRAADGTEAPVELLVDLKDGLPTLLFVDVVDWDEAPEDLRREIVTDGQVVYER